MFLLIVCQILLLTFLLQATGEQNEQTTPNPDHSAQYQEFCLHIPENSHWTTSEPGTQLPTQSSNPTNQPTKQKSRVLKQPAESERNETLESSEEIVPKLEDTMRPMFAAPLNNPLGLYEELNNCRCNKETMKQPRSGATALVILYPSTTCSKMEYIETLEDGREVCTTPFSLFAYLFLPNLGSDLMPGSIGVPSVPSTEQPVSTTTEPILTTQPETPDLMPVTINDISQCESCSSQTSLDDVDLKAVQSLNVKFQPSPCPNLISINLKDKTVFCWDQLNLTLLLEKLEMIPPQEENVVAGCRCYGKAKKHSVIASLVKDLTLWLPGENCSSTEIITSLEDGSELCVKGTNINIFVETEVKLHVVDESEFEGGDFLLSAIHEGKYDVQLKPCRWCQPNDDWNSIQPKDIKSITVDLVSSHCPDTFIKVDLTDGRILCMDSTWPQFKKLLEKLDFKPKEEKSLV